MLDDRLSPHLLTATTLSLSEFLERLSTVDSVLQLGIPGLTNLSKVVYVENETWARPRLLQVRRGDQRTNACVVPQHKRIRGDSPRS